MNDLLVLAIFTVSAAIVCVAMWKRRKRDPNRFIDSKADNQRCICFSGVERIEKPYWVIADDLYGCKTAHRDYKVGEVLDPAELCRYVREPILAEGCWFPWRITHEISDDDGSIKGWYAVPLSVSWGTLDYTPERYRDYPDCLYAK